MTSPIRTTTREHPVAQPDSLDRIGTPKRAEQFSGTLAAWLTRLPSVKADFAGDDEAETRDPEPIKVSAPIVGLGGAKI